MHVRSLLIVLLALLCGATALAQRGGRDDGSRRRPNARSGGGEMANLKFEERLWFGAGGTLGFQGGNGQSFTQIGLLPQVGYKFNNWLSAGPRFGATVSLVKSFALPESGGGDVDTRRYSTVDYTVGGFVRGRYRQFYVQTEYNVRSVEFAPRVRLNAFETAVLIDPSTNDVLTERQGEDQLQIGVGYAPPTGGGLGTDIGIFYNLFDDVRSISTSPIESRVQLTFRY